MEDAGSPVLAQAKLVAYAPADTSEFASKSPYMFHGAVSNMKIAGPVAEWLKDKNIKNVAIIVSEDGWGTSVLNGFLEGVKEAGANVVLNESISSQSDSPAIMASDVTKAKNAKADAILFTGYDEEATVLVEKRMQLDFMVPVLVHTQVYGQLLARGAVTQDEVKNIDTLGNPVSQEFTNKFKEKYGELPGNYAASAYDGVMILVDAIKNKSENESIADYLRTKTDYEGYQTEYSFDENGDIKGGEWIVTPL